MAGLRLSAGYYSGQRFAEMESEGEEGRRASTDDKIFPKKTRGWLKQHATRTLATSGVTKSFRQQVAEQFRDPYKQQFLLRSVFVKSQELAGELSDKSGVFDNIASPKSSWFHSQPE